MNWVIREKIDLVRGFVDVNIWKTALMIPGDKGAHKWEIEVKKDGVPYNLTGCEAKAHMIRADNVDVILEGRIIENVISVEFTELVYAVPGQIRCLMKITDGETVMTVCETYFRVRNPLPGNAIYPSEEPEATNQFYTTDGNLFITADNMIFTVAGG